MIQIGMVLYGFCGGAFGRDSYDDKRVEARGVDWVVVRSVQSGRPDFFIGDPADLEEYAVKPEGDE